MAKHKSFKSVATKINKALDNANVRSLNRAVDAGKTQTARLVSEDLGLAQGLIKRRIRTIKSKVGTLKATVSIGVKARFFMDDFSAAIKNVKTAVGRRQAVTVKVGRSGKVVVPGLFPILVTGKRSRPNAEGVSSKNFIGIRRKGDSRLPTERPVFNNFIPTLRKHTNAIQRTMVDTFRKNHAFYINDQMKKLK